jgi:hypothetical protein
MPKLKQEEISECLDAQRERLSKALVALIDAEVDGGTLKGFPPEMLPGLLNGVLRDLQKAVNVPGAMAAGFLSPQGIEGLLLPKFVEQALGNGVGVASGQVKPVRKTRGPGKNKTARQEGSKPEAVEQAVPTAKEASGEGFSIPGLSIG